MNQCRRRHSCNKNKPERRIPPKRNNTAKLGDLLTSLVERQISSQRARYGALTQAWSRLLPSELAQHCEIVRIAGGQLTVQVDLSAYMYELQLCSSELLEQLRKNCPRARIEKIKIILKGHSQ